MGGCLGATARGQRRTVPAMNERKATLAMAAQCFFQNSSKLLIPSICFESSRPGVSTRGGSGDDGVVCHVGCRRRGVALGSMGGGRGSENSTPPPGGSEEAASAEAL